MVREALFLLDPIEIGFEKAWVINLLVRFIRFVQKHVELKLTKTTLTLLGPTYFLYTKARGGVKFHPPLKSQLSLKKSMFFCHEVNFCINSALFWCITLVSSSMLTKISNFIEKRSKFGTFLKIELYASYLHQNKAKTT